MAQEPIASLPAPPAPTFIDLFCGCGGFTFADLDTPFFLTANPFDGGYAITGGKTSVAHIAAGHGMVPKW